MPAQTYGAVIRREGQWYVANCAELGIVSQGRTSEEAAVNLREAVKLYLKEFPKSRGAKAG